jgi:flagellar FliL protein
MAEQTKDSPKPKSSKLVFLIVGLVLLLAASGAGWFLLARGKNHSGTAEAAPKEQPEFTERLESFTVNLNDQEENHFLRVTMELGLAHPPKVEASSKEGADSSGFPMARTRDTILSVLTSCKADELLTPEGKATLKHNLLAALQQRVPEIEARDVYFTEFLVQR